MDERTVLIDEHIVSAYSPHPQAISAFNALRDNLNRIYRKKRITPRICVMKDIIRLLGLVSLMIPTLIKI